MRVLVVIGTRPEAIKMAPVINALSRSSTIQTSVLSTGQHREMIKPIFKLFDIQPDIDLDVMGRAGSLNALTSLITQEFDRVLDEQSPDLVLVHGDTTSAAACATAAFHRRIPVGHVEAGLRSGDLTQPWPEEYNRRVIDIATSLHFAPTESSANNLLQENYPPAGIHITGNTVVDALLAVSERITTDADLSERLNQKFSFLDGRRDLLLVTGHRRENFGEGIQQICRSLLIIADRFDLDIVYPVHLNPNVTGPVHNLLSNEKRIHLIEPVDYAEFVYLLRAAKLILTDSGGIQEEAPTFGTPVLVMRNVTERQEAIDAGTAQLVGTSPQRIVAAVAETLEQMSSTTATPPNNPFGDGRAAERIVDVIQVMANTSQSQSISPDAVVEMADSH